MHRTYGCKEETVPVLDSSLIRLLETEGEHDKAGVGDKAINQLGINTPEDTIETYKGSRAQRRAQLGSMIVSM